VLYEVAKQNRFIRVETWMSKKQDLFFIVLWMIIFSMQNCIGLTTNSINK